jgi:3-deoxy-D-manno-octulosonate 8-phosphate phosphatase (KDO 8-P phosphatase)
MDNLLEHLATVTSFVFDVDGVFTDGNMILTESGDMLRTMNTRDGYAVKKLTRAGVPVCVITGGKSEAVRLRMNSLGIADVFLDIGKKESVLEMWIERKEVDPKGICYMGDDVADYHSMMMAGFRTCPNDADPEIINICHYVSPFDGGRGCVRDVVEKYLRVTKRWSF